MTQVKARKIVLSLWLCVMMVGVLSATHGVLAQASPTETPRPTREPIPTSTPIPTPVPLAGNGVQDCPVSSPNLTESPDEYYISAETGYGNPEGTLFIGLWVDGKVIFHPGGGGEISRDGSMAMKFWFYRTVPGEVVFEGVRLDEPGSEAAHIATLRGPADGYGETGFHPANLKFPSQGCWEVTASVGQDRMTFVTLVVWLPFQPLWPGWLPKMDIETKTTDLSDYPNTIEFVTRYENEGALTLSTTQGAGEAAESGYDSALQEVTINEQAATCVLGAWDGETWDAEADAGVLFWSDEALSYTVTQTGLGLTCDDLLRVPFFLEDQ